MFILSTNTFNRVTFDVWPHVNTSHSFDPHIDRQPGGKLSCDSDISCTQRTLVHFHQNSLLLRNQFIERTLVLTAETLQQCLIWNEALRSLIVWPRMVLRKHVRSPNVRLQHTLHITHHVQATAVRLIAPPTIVIMHSLELLVNRWRTIQRCDTWVRCVWCIHEWFFIHFVTKHRRNLDANSVPIKSS